MRRLSVSILSADLGRLAEQVRRAEAAGADWIHVDVMDGHFVPNISFGPQLVGVIRRTTRLPLDVHLMIERPERHLKAFVDAGADRLGVHQEATVHLHRVLQQIRELGARPTVVLTPATPLCALDHVLEEVEMVLLMTVNPGFSGQELIRAVLPKIRRMRRKIDEEGLGVLLEVDGGVHQDTAGALVDAGADVLVAGSEVFGDGEVERNIRALKQRMG